MGDETQKKRRPEFDLAFATPTGLMLAEAKAFPDYLKMIERMIPKLGPLIDRYMEVARLDTRLLDQLTRIDTNELIEQAVASRASALTAAEPAPRVEEMLSRIAISTQFPDFSKLFEEIDTGRVFTEYAAAMPRAKVVADAYVREEAGTEVGVTGTVSVADWVRGLAPETRRRLIVRLGAAVAATIGLAGHALEQRNVLLAGAMLALATTLYAIYVEAKDVAE